MGDTISRQAALDAISCDITITGRRNAELVAETIGAFVDRIKALPSAGPKTGKWERHYSRPNVYADLLWHCSECGYRSSDNWADKFNFCPNCGADMRQREEGET